VGKTYNCRSNGSKEIVRFGNLSRAVFRRIRRASVTYGMAVPPSGGQGTTIFRWPMYLVSVGSIPIVIDLDPVTIRILEIDLADTIRPHLHFLFSCPIAILDTQLIQVFHKDGH